MENSTNCGKFKCSSLASNWFWLSIFKGSKGVGLACFSEEGHIIQFIFVGPVASVIALPFAAVWGCSQRQYLGEQMLGPNGSWNATFVWRLSLWIPALSQKTIQSKSHDVHRTPCWNDPQQTKLTFFLMIFGSLKGGELILLSPSFCTKGIGTEG